MCYTNDAFQRSGTLFPIYYVVCCVCKSNRIQTGVKGLSYQYLGRHPKYVLQGAAIKDKNELQKSSEYRSPSSTDSFETWGIF